MSVITPYEPHQLAPAWRDVHRFWLRLMEVYARDCQNAGVDNLNAQDLRYSRSHIANYMHSLINARTAAERERIIGEASQFLAEQEHRARLATPPPMKTVGEVRLDKIDQERSARQPLKAISG